MDDVEGVEERAEAHGRGEIWCWGTEAGVRWCDTKNAEAR